MLSPNATPRSTSANPSQQVQGHHREQLPRRSTDVHGPAAGSSSLCPCFWGPNELSSTDLVSPMGHACLPLFPLSVQQPRVPPHGCMNPEITKLIVHTTGAREILPPSSPSRSLAHSQRGQCMLGGDASGSLPVYTAFLDRARELRERGCIGDSEYMCRGTTSHQTRAVPPIAVSFSLFLLSLVAIREDSQ